MKYLKSLLIIALASFSLFANAQDPKAKAILDELSNKTRTHSTITSDFTFTLDDKAADLKQTQEGTLKMKGKKYVIKLGDYLIFSDGETRWNYNEDMNEVYIDYAASDAEALNPSEIYTVWETGFKHYYDKEITENGKKYHLIKLNPVDPADKSYHTIKLYVDQAKMEVSKIEILGKGGENYTYNVKSFKTDVPYTTDTFTFNKDKYPGVEVIDNR